MSYRPKPENDGKKVKTKNITVSLFEGDHELVVWLASYLGSNRSDAVRSAIRAFAMYLQAIEKRKG